MEVKSEEFVNLKIHTQYSICEGAVQIDALKDLSKEFIDELSHDTQKKLSQSDISDHEVYMLNHKLSVLQEIKI